MASFHHHVSSGRPGTALEHARYVQRLGKYSKRGDLIYSACANMPSWAAGNEMLFWDAADRNERVNGAAYREQVIAIPNELARDQQIALAHELARRLVGFKPYVLAIHAPIAALGEQPNVHVHIVYTDRVPDGIERAPGGEFRRFNRADPALGGWRKDSGGKTRMQTRDQVIGWRKTSADTQNEFLEANGHSARVDYRSLEQQGIARTPERHLGPWRVRNMSLDETVEYAQVRQSAAIGKATAKSS